MPNIVFADSFDHYALADMTAKGYTQVSGNPISFTTAAGRNGTTGLRSGSTTSLTLISPNFGNQPSLYVGFAYRTTGNSDLSVPCQLLDNGNTQMEIRQSNSGELKVTRNGTQLGITAGLSMQVNTWYYIEFMATIHPSAGVVAVRVNGNQVISLTGQNTRATANSYAQQVRFNGAYGNTSDLDDLVIATDGFSGDCRVQAVFPEAAGNYTQWGLPSTAYGFSGGQGDRRSLITLTQNATSPLLGATPAPIIDGDRAVAMNSAVITIDSTKYVRFDFGVGRVINEATWYQNQASATGGIWKWQGSNNASTWVDIGASFTLGGGQVQVHYTLAQNTTPYRYYQMLGVSGSAINMQPFELEFKIDNAANALAAWQCVDEVSMNSDVDYVLTATPGQRISYGFAALGLTGAIKGVQHVSTMRKDDAGTRMARQFVRIGGSDYDSADISASDSYVMQRRAMPTNPATGSAWTTVVIDGMEAGTMLAS